MHKRMNNKTGKPASLTRREALIGGSSVAAMTLNPSVSFATDDNELHSRVAARVRTLTKGHPTTLRLLLPNGSRGNVDPLIQAFKTMTGVDIAATEAPVDDINTVLSLDALSNTESFDVALPATFALPDLATAKAILPLNDYAHKYEPDGFRDGILYSIGDSFDGDTYGFQADGDAYLMFYNTDMLNNPDEQARYAVTFGKPLVRPDIWQELDRQMAFFHRPDDGKYGGMLLRAPGYTAWEWWIRFQAKGVWPFSPEMEPQITTDAGIGALEDMIRASEHMAPGASQLGLFDNWERFSQGDIYCTIGWGGSQKYFNRPASKIRNKLTYGPTPGGFHERQ